MDDLRSQIEEIFDGDVRFDEPMSAHTSLNIGGPAEVMLFPQDPLSLKRVVFAADKEDIPLLVFGAGTNLLVPDEGIRGIAISLREFRSIDPARGSDDERTVLFVGAGVPLAMLIRYAADKGLTGIEALNGIPGYVGGAVYMNAGSFGVEMMDLIRSVAVMDRNGDIKIIEKDDMNFSYRSSGLPVGSVILSANIALKKGDPEEVKKRTKEFLLKKKETQPLGEHSAGCVFKNPAGDSAGRLIDNAGCKGMKNGGVEVSGVHANYFINRGGATYKEFIELIETVKNRVKESSGIELEPEIEIVR